MIRLSLAAAALTLALAAPAFADEVAPGSSPSMPIVPHHVITPIRHHRDADLGNARATDALNTLEAQGYTEFSDFRQDGSNFAATVTQKGQQFTVIVNPDTHQVTRQS
jgi:hypothetical protein